MFSFQVDEPTDVTSCAQWLVFMRYILSVDVKEEMFSKELQTATSADVLEKLKLILILQSGSGNMFVGFVLLELLQ